MSKKINVVTTSKAIELLGVSRMTFYNKYKFRLEQMPSTDNKCYYKLEDVNKLVEEKNKPTANYNIIE